MINNTMQRRYLKTAAFVTFVVILLKAKVTRHAFLLLVFLSASASAQLDNPRTTFTRIDSNVVWHAPPDFMTAFHKTCDSLGGSAFQNCFLHVMKKMGASAEAIRFTRLTDTTGYVRHFVDAGTVGVAYVFYPFRANENFGITLVNGKPGMIDVDDFRYVDLIQLKKDSTYLGILDSFPDAAVWPGDRFRFDRLKCESSAGGGERFIVQYVLKNGCHACEDIGIVDFAFDFDRQGNFTGTRLVRVVRTVH